MNAALLFGHPIVAWRRFAPRSVLRVLTICAAIGALPVVTIYYGREPTATPRMTGIAGLGGIAGARSVASPSHTAGLDADDPVVRFAQSRVGHILYEPYVGDFCRRVLFHNLTGALYESERILCVQTVPESRPLSNSDRLLKVRNSFHK